MNITKSEYNFSMDKKIKEKSRNKLASLFNRGNISNDDFICAICGRQPINKHHETYEIWYSFIPLCNECHGKCKKYGNPVEFNHGKIDGLTIHKDTGIRISGHIVWLGVDSEGKEHKVMLPWNKKKKKRDIVYI